MVRTIPADTTTERSNILWLKGDALSQNQVMAATEGANVILHAVNPPGYRHWDTQVLPMLDNTLQAAKHNQALVVLPGTLYNYGPDAFPLVDENSPQQPITRKGRIRVAMESRLQAYSQHGGQSLIVRAGDFFGPRAGNNWFAQGLIQPGRPVKRIMLPGMPNVGHYWCYLPDVAKTMLQLISRRQYLPAFARYHMQGHWDDDGQQMARAINRVLSRHNLPTASIRRFPWWLAALAAPFNTTFREVLEMRYLWQQELRMNNALLCHELGSEPHTPLNEEVDATLSSLGNLP